MPVPLDADGVAETELAVGDGVGDVVGGGLAGAGLLVGVLAGDGLADGDPAGVATGDGAVAGRVTGAGTGIGSVSPAGELGSSVMSGSVGAGLCCAAGAAAGVAAGVAGAAGPVWYAGRTAALFAAVAPGCPAG